MNETPPLVAPEPGSPHVLRVPPISSARPPDDAALRAWQSRLLPFLMWMLGGVSVFFLVATLVQLNSLQRRIENAPVLDLAPALAALEGQQSSTDRLVFAQWRTLASLEKYALERRYHQANILLLSRTWTRYLGFMTGMMLALVGAAFILGKLREEASTLGLKQAGIEANLTTTSPGLVLCVLGVVLMLTALSVHNDIETRDVPAYTNVQVSAGTGAPEPLPLRVSEVPDPLPALAGGEGEAQAAVPADERGDR